MPDTNTTNSSSSNDNDDVNEEEIERKIRDMVEHEVRERLEQERVERETVRVPHGEKIEREMVEKQLIDEIQRLKIEKQQLEQQQQQQQQPSSPSSSSSSSSSSHVFLSTFNKQQLPTYINVETLEVSINEYNMDPNEMASGSFASVYKGVHTASKREVVIKKIKGAAANTKNETKFSSEISKIRLLVHPGIPKVEAFYRFNNIDMCVVFHESNGLSIRHIMDENARTNKVSKTVPSLLSSDLIRLTVRLIEILDYVHSIGVVHYDIKPENVLLCNSEYGVQLIDFGSAGFVSATSQTANMSTLSYSPPEKLDPLVFDDIKSNKKSMTKLDVWSLGATILNSCCSALILTDEYDDSDDLRPYFSITSLARGVIKLDDDHKIPWDLDLVLSKYFEVCREAKAVWDAVDSDVKDIIRACLTHDISKRPFTRDITQMQSYQRLRNMI